MQAKPALPFPVLLMMISFASVNAVMFTPALPDIATFFDVSHDSAQLTITWFLVGYACGQLFYGPIANRYGRKPALYCGIILQIISSLICVLAGVIDAFWLLVIGRLMLALGSGVGLKMTFTLVNECYEPKAATKKISYLILSFAITPGLSAALGGVLNHHFGWMSCFIACTIYGCLLAIMATRLPETMTEADYDALKWKHLIRHYAEQFKIRSLILGAMIMGITTCFVYSFAAVAPFVAIDILGFNSAEYGIANIIPSIGLMIGSLVSAKLSDTIAPGTMIRTGIILTAIASLIMLFSVYRHASAINSVFIPMMLVYMGLSSILANAASIAMRDVTDKAHGSAVMNFINMGFATITVLIIGWLPLSTYLLPTMFLIFCSGMFGLYQISKR